MRCSIIIEGGGKEQGTNHKCKRGILQRIQGKQYSCTNINSKIFLDGPKIKNKK